MDVKTWTYLIVGITFVAYIGIAIWSKAKSTKEFYVAGGGGRQWDSRPRRPPKITWWTVLC